MLVARLPLNVQNNGAVSFIHAGLLFGVLGAVDDGGHIG
jgi:hypothetical protein